MHLKTADRIATRLGYHPVEIWGFDEWMKLDPPLRIELGPEDLSDVTLGTAA